MHILLTNDDGIRAPGLWALLQRLAASFQVTVVAPDRERSAVGHGITLHRPLRASEVPMENGTAAFAVSGTPADCVKLAILELMESRPDLVVSGINPGANVGVNINYSGTVAAAKEATLYGIPAISVSREGHGDDHYGDIADFIARFSAMTVANGLPFGTFLNVNFPNLPVHHTAGVRIAAQSVEMFKESIERRTDPRNHAYYWQGCDAQTFQRNPDADGAVLHNRYISITPIKCDATDYEALESMKAWPIDNPET